MAKTAAHIINIHIKGIVKKKKKKKDNAATLNTLLSLHTFVKINKTFYTKQAFHNIEVRVFV